MRIEAPVERVWELFIDRSRLHEWTPRSEFTSFSGPLDQVGTTFSDTTRLMGLDFKMTNEVVEVEPLRLYHEHTDTGPVDTVLRLEPDGDATRVIVDSDYDIAIRMPGFLKDLLIKGWGERNARQMMHKFKALVEAEVRAQA